MASKTNSFSIIVLISLLLWFTTAVVLGFSGKIAEIPFPFPQVILFGLVVVQLIIFGLSAGFRIWIYGFDIRYLVAVHLSRFVGFYFLYLYSMQMLPYDFAVIGGVGDIIVAATALIILVLVSSRSESKKKIYLLWNTFGIIDILFVVATAGRIGMNSPESIENLLKIPLSLLPTFLVPIIIFTHIVIFIRLLRKG